MKKLLKIIFSRAFYIALAILLQVLWIIALVYIMSDGYKYVADLISVASIILVLWIVNKKVNPSYKLAWTILILSLPLFGVVIYFLFGQSRIARKMEKNNEEVRERVDVTVDDARAMSELFTLDEHIGGQSRYIQDYAGFSLFKQTQTRYYPVGEKMFPDMLEALEGAQHFIFMEYFIIAQGEMWNKILDILERKVRQGVDVRLIYDDLGCITTLPNHFYKRLQMKGIKCASFNPFRPIVNVVLNNRDHRKILVVDGYIGFTGGINLADEYINEIRRFGYWKDTGLRCVGEGVWNFTVMFLQMWAVITHIQEDFAPYKPHVYHPAAFSDDGYVQPYGDSPLDNETVGENVYLNIINNARRYVDIFTPYLIIDNEMMTALCLASKRGVSVRIITPGTPDKKTVFLLTQSYYEQLLEAGVRIYEYLPGFLHAKCFVCDDEIATVGTVNLDYRSLYLHFECGCWMYKSSAVMQARRDIESTLHDCKPITLTFCRGRNIFIRMIQSVMRLLAPML